MHEHFLTFVSEYEMEYEKTYGYYRPIITEVVEKYVDCGDLQKAGLQSRWTESFLP